MEFDKIKGCVSAIRRKTDFVPKAALVLGSGLGGFADSIDTVTTVDYKDIDGMPQSTVQGHKGRFVFGYVGKVPVVIMQGRVHYYEGYSIKDVVRPIRVMRMLGAEILFLTNASGGINTDYKAGDFMLIKDHISFFVPSPLIGENIDELGVRFPDMSSVYDVRLQDIIKRQAAELGINIREGVYAQAGGPNFETPAEVRMLRTLGADAVGMSTVCEAIAAVHCGFRVCGISCVTNPGAGVCKKPLCHEEVQEAADKAAPAFKALLSKSIKNML